MLGATFCIGINTHSAKNEKLCEIYLKNLFFQNVLVLIDLFHGHHFSVISSTQTCDFMFVQHVINYFYITYRKKLFFSVKSFFYRPWLLLDNVKAVFHI